MPTRRGAARRVRRARRRRRSPRTRRTSRPTRWSRSAPAPGTIVERRSRFRRSTSPNGSCRTARGCSSSRRTSRRTRCCSARTSPGGTSLAPDADYMSAALASQIVGTERRRQLQPRSICRRSWRARRRRLGASIGETSEGLIGRASPKDLETMFQLDLSRLHRAAARHGGVSGVQEPGRVRTSRTAASIRTQVFGDTVLVTMAQHNFRARPLTRGDVRRGRIRRRRSRSTRIASPTRATSRSCSSATWTR